jgi:hypothetical protein
MGWQDPSVDIENVNAAYRLAAAERDRYQAALQAIIDMAPIETGGLLARVVQTAQDALDVDDLS